MLPDSEMVPNDRENENKLKKEIIIYAKYVSEKSMGQRENMIMKTCKYTMQYRLTQTRT